MKTVKETGTVSHATMRTQDLIPVFMDFIEEHRENDEELELPTFEGEIVEPRVMYDEDPWWESEDASWYLNEYLWDLMNECAPEGYYFGAHEGDGSDYGFWPYPYDEESYWEEKTWPEVD